MALCGSADADMAIFFLSDPRPGAVALAGNVRPSLIPPATATIGHGGLALVGRVLSPSDITLSISVMGAGLAFSGMARGHAQELLTVGGLALVGTASPTAY